MVLHLIIASKNMGKIKEIKSLLSDMPVILTSLHDYPKIGDIEETGDTFHENALIKARTVAKETGFWTIADDSGIEVDALDGRPGVYSARYAGEQSSDVENCDKLLKEMKGIPDSKRGAQFKAVIVLANNQEYFTFEDIVRGKIIREKRGESGFGYDPVFIPEGHTKTFAQLGEEVKNTMSHRSRALIKMKKFMKSGEFFPLKQN